MRIVTKGATSKSIYMVVMDSTSTTGGRKTGLAFDTAGLTAYYVRNGGLATAITLATLSAADSAYSSGGFKEVDPTNMPGLYRLDVPNAAIASGVDSVIVTLRGATGMVQVSEELQLTGVDLMDAVRFGMTSLPNAAAEAAGGLYTRGTGAGQINQSANGQVDSKIVTITAGIIAAASFAAGALDAVWSTTVRILTAGTNIPTAPTAESNATAVRTELVVELARIDATTSSRATPVQVKTQMTDALSVDTYAEPGQAAPAATTTMVVKLGYLYKLMRNKITQDATTLKIFGDDATTVDQKATVSDDGTTYTRGEIGTGP